MSDSLQDQLLALGLAKDRPEKKKPAGRKRPNSARGGKPQGRGHGGGKPRQGGPGKQGQGAGKGGEISLDAAWKARQKDEKVGADKARAEKLARDLERRRINGEIEAMVKDQGLNDREGELKRNFLYKGKIRSVRVNAEQLEALNAGTLALVFLRGDYLVVPPALAEKVKALSPDHVPELGGDDPAEEEFPVPDDLVW